MRPKGTPKTGGRVAGTPNKVTSDFRATVTRLLERNDANVDRWLSEVGDGKQAVNKDGEALFGEYGEPIMEMKPNPAKALDILSSLAEYAAPKLSRTEVVGDPQTPLTLLVKEISGNSIGPVSDDD